MNAKHRRPIRNFLAAFTFVLGLAACSGGASEKAADTAADATAAAAAVPAAPDTARAMSDAEVMDAHLRAMVEAGADSAEAMLPAHRQMVANLIAKYNQDMRAMGMAGDDGWTATIDSLRKDLTRMPELSASELQLLLPGHGERVRRLMKSHRGMMGDMKM